MQFVSENWKFRGADIALRNRHASVKTFAFRNWCKIQVLALRICSPASRPPFWFKLYVNMFLIKEVINYFRLCWF